MDFEAGYNPDSVVAPLRNGRPIIFETAEIKAKEWDGEGHVSLIGSTLIRE